MLVTDLESGDQRLVKAQDMADDALAEPLDAAVRAGKSGSVEHEGRSYFLNVQVPPVRLVVIGAVHITQALAPMAKLAGFDLTTVWLNDPDGVTNYFAQVGPNSRTARAKAK